MAQWGYCLPPSNVALDLILAQCHTICGLGLSRWFLPCSIELQFPPSSRQIPIQPAGDMASSPNTNILIFICSSL